MFLVFEGGEACGKTTQIELLKQHLLKLGKKVLVTREPGGTPFAEALRSLFKVKSTTDDEPLPMTELFVVMAARNQHIQKVILPALKSGHVVLCDRFLDSTYVYQGYLGGVPLAIINQVAETIMHTLQPTVTFVLDVDTTVTYQRIKNRTALLASASDRYDESSIERLKILRRGFQSLLQDNVPYPNNHIPKRVLIEASGTADHTRQLILKNCDFAQ